MRDDVKSMSNCIETLQNKEQLIILFQKQEKTSGLQRAMLQKGENYQICSVEKIFWQLFRVVPQL